MFSEGRERVHLEQLSQKSECTVHLNKWLVLTVDIKNNPEHQLNGIKANSSGTPVGYCFLSSVHKVVVVATIGGCAFK